MEIHKSALEAYVAMDGKQCGKAVRESSAGKQDLDQFGRYIDTFKSLFYRWLKHIGLNFNTFAVFYSLSTSEKGYCTQKDIAVEWLIPKQTVFNVCKQFQEVGWIELTISEADKRERIVCLTELGRTEADKVLAHWDSLDQRVFQMITEEHKIQLFASLATFMQVLEVEVERSISESIL